MILSHFKYLYSFFVKTKLLLLYHKFCLHPQLRPHGIKLGASSVTQDLAGLGMKTVLASYLRTLFVSTHVFVFGHPATVLPSQQNLSLQEMNCVK
jgi:hypothetical protein